MAPFRDNLYNNHSVLTRLWLKFIPPVEQFQKFVISIFTMTFFLGSVSQLVAPFRILEWNEARDLYLRAENFQSEHLFPKSSAKLLWYRSFQ